MARKGVLIGLLVAVLSSTAWAFNPFFGTAGGQKLSVIQEGRYFYVVVDDPEKGRCGIDSFTGTVYIIDPKTGAFIYDGAAVFREFTVGSGRYFWVNNLNQKIAVQVGTRDWAGTNHPQFTHTLPTVLGSGGLPVGWYDGNWIYLDEDWTGGTLTGPGALPQNRWAERVRLDHTPVLAALAYNRAPGAPILQPLDPTTGLAGGRVENMDTLILIVTDAENPRNVDQDQIKILDTVATLEVSPTIDYGCTGCPNITVTIRDADQNLDPTQIDYVPFFMIINPGSWNPSTVTPWTDNPLLNWYSPTNFSELLIYGGTDAFGFPLDPGGPASVNPFYPIRWYNIYSGSDGVTPLRYIDYTGAPWWPAAAPISIVQAVFFAPETGPDTGEFSFNFGTPEDMMRLLFGPAFGAVRFQPGTTFAFYYIDPNDPDDMDLAVSVVPTTLERAKVYFTNDLGTAIPWGGTVKIGHGGLYIRVYDGTANYERCCQDRVVVHIVDPHNEDDSEYVLIDEISNDSGVFFSQFGVPLLPVWDAQGGYQLVFDDGRLQAFNEDTIFVRYNSVQYSIQFLNSLGDANPNDGWFMPDINLGNARVITAGPWYQPWNVAFAKVKVYDTQVFDGAQNIHNMRFLDGNYQPISGTVPIGGQLYLEVVDPDQNEDPLRRENIFGQWNKDLNTADDQIPGNFPLDDIVSVRPPFAEDHAPMWPAYPPPDSQNPLGIPGAGGYQGIPGFADDNSIFRGALPPAGVGKPATVSIWIMNAQNGFWERMDLRETTPGSGIFRSTTCVLVSTGPLSGTPGVGNLGSALGDTIFAYYQDPSNHSDVSIISIKVGSAAAQDPTTQNPTVTISPTTVKPGDTVTITVTDPVYAGQSEITGTGKVLTLTDAAGVELMFWQTIPAKAGMPGVFEVTYQLPTTVATGNLVAVYTDPNSPTRTASFTAQVSPGPVSDVSDVRPVPDVITATTPTVFTVYTTPAGSVVSRFKITVYDLTGKKVWEDTKSNTNTITWDGGNLRNGAYIYVAEVTWPGGTKPFKGFVYIKR